jgi:nudix-type nucleoside diphosphatase (YffH/AdpP family)
MVMSRTMNGMRVKGAKKMSRQEVVWSGYGFEGKLVKVRLDTVKLANGDQREREIVEHPGAVAIVPVTDDGHVVLVRQYRPAVGQSMLELPAGTVEKGEDVARTAQRELEEETGYSAGELRELVRFWVSPGWCNEDLVIYVANDVTAGEQSLEDDEEIEVELVDPQRIPELMRKGEIADSKTMVGLSLYFGIFLDPKG